MAKSSNNIRKEVSEKLVSLIEMGTLPWRQPWTGSCPSMIPTRSNGEPYKGINILMLMAQANHNGFSSPYWMTYRQAQEMGAQVRKGEKATMVTKYGMRKIGKDDDAEDKTIPFLRAYQVFNASQIDGLETDFYPVPEAPRDLGTARDADMDRIFSRIGAVIRVHDHPGVAYDAARDEIRMPRIETFHDANGFYATLARLLVQWTGSEKRLARFDRDPQGADRAFEELVSEIGACMLCLKVGLVPDFEQSSAYIAHWVKLLKSDDKLIFRAASQAQKAVDLIEEKIWPKSLGAPSSQLLATA